MLFHESAIAFKIIQQWHPFDNARYWYLIYLCQTDDSHVIIITSAEPRESRLVYRWPARHVLGSCIVTKDFSSAGSGNLEPGRPFASPAEKPHLLHHLSFFYVDQKYQIGGSEILTSLSFGFSLSGSNQGFFSLVYSAVELQPHQIFFLGSNFEIQWWNYAKQGGGTLTKTFLLVENAHNWN